MNRICELRKQRMWLQDDLAKKLNVSRQAISNYETGERGLDSETIAKLCEIFACSADYLLGLSDLPRPELSDEEQLLLLAFRRADGRARELVRLALEPFAQDGTAERAI